MTFKGRTWEARHEMIASKHSLKKHPCAKFVVQYITCDVMAWLESEAWEGIVQDDAMVVFADIESTVAYNLLNLSPTVPSARSFPQTSISVRFKAHY
jgi:hypothetical protein